MTESKPSKISVIITTFNWAYALRAVLNALVEQKTTYAFEIIVADDGSSDETAKLIRSIKNRVSIPILHIWQSNEGFRAAAIRNKAIVAAEGDYVVFLDGDCIPREDFIESHGQLAESKTFVAGNRILLSQEFTLSALSKTLPLHQWSFWRWCIARLLGQCNRIFPLISLPFGNMNFKTSSKWKGAKGCNLGIWKADLLKVNGWEENFVGWGYEDSDLVIRLLRAGVQRKSGRFKVPVVHLWHPENDRSNERDNWKRLKDRQKLRLLSAEKGLSQYEH